VLLEDGEFGVALLPHLSAGLRSASPLVFFNACHSGRLGFTLLGLGSWGAELIRLGCGAFVGSLWPVRDESAVVFAECFYRSLANGAPIGESVRLAREEVRRRSPGDPTWLAYCCFADPLARRA
jgi:CHAT domain-containing protein